MSSKNYLGTIKIIEKETNRFVTKIDGEGDFSLSKSNFVNFIEINEKGFCNISFNEFFKIFEIIEEISNEYKKYLRN